MACFEERPLKGLHTDSRFVYVSSVFCGRKMLLKFAFLPIKFFFCGAIRTLNFYIMPVKNRSRKGEGSVRFARLLALQV
jgi:hypothetical protein